MNHLKMNFAVDEKAALSTAGGSATIYNLVCTNNSTADWVFYVYQTMPSQPSDIILLSGEIQVP
jgi:rhizosphere induced protein